MLRVIYKGEASLKRQREVIPAVELEVMCGVFCKRIRMLFAHALRVQRRINLKKQ